MSTIASPNEALTSEVQIINSIYPEDTLSPTSPDSNIDRLVYRLRLPFPSFDSITLRIEFPADYPNAPPSILGTESVGEDVQKGVGKQVVDIVRRVLGEVYKPEEPCVFDLLEEVREALERAEEAGTLLQSHESEETQTQLSQQYAAETMEDATAYVDYASMPPPPWITAPSLTEKKSIFLARVAPVSSPAQAKSYIKHLLATDKKAAKATHNISAWRIRGENGATYQDCDDDGETAAGGRLLHLMQLMDVWDVMVVVTRWYGGVLLGPDRFRIINTAAREALALGGWAREGKDREEGRKKGKR